MKLKSKQYKRYYKAPCCNNEASVMYSIDGKNWFCSDCLCEVLLNDKLFIEEDDYKKGFELLMEFFDDIHDEDKVELDKKLKRLNL